MQQSVYRVCGGTTYEHSETSVYWHTAYVIVFAGHSDQNNLMLFKKKKKKKKARA